MTFQTLSGAKMNKQYIIDGLIFEGWEGLQNVIATLANVELTEEQAKEILSKFSDEFLEVSYHHGLDNDEFSTELYNYLANNPLILDSIIT
ncbi:hypothetical protein [Vibrio anguillarum]|uniref:hypothetical protein n=3 Tax=Vibrio anguillarum TaxID=55601 RepID=UPI000BB4EEB0|nr:hypothetical protein [Vibrio anguillarum]ATC60199.1 hypothetical protein CMV05_22680 [Vibrio anguillarum]MBF4342125.1 hypothetical protein [Vibrio anguillarum]